MADADLPDGRQRRLALGVSWLAYATYYLGRKGFSALKKPLERDLGIVPGALGAIDTAFLAAYTVGQFASGFAGDRFGARRLVGYGMLLSAVACAGFGMSGGALAFGAWFFLNGLAQSTGWPGNTRIVAEWTSRENRGTVMGLWSTCYQLGGLFATVLAGQLATRFGWRSAMLVPAVAILAVGLVVLAILPRPPALVLAPSAAGSDPANSALPGASSTPFAVLRNATLWSFGASYFFIKLVRYALLFWLPYYLATARGYSTGKAANVSIAFDAGGMVGVVVIGWLADRRRLSHAALSMLSIALLVPVLVGHRALGGAGEVGEVVMLALAGALLVGPESLLSGAAAQDAGGPAAAASATGFVNGLGSFGALLQGVVVPPLAARFGWTALFPALGVLALGAMVALLPTLIASRGSR
ncbi:MAG TPA: MFS transporter [Polyangiaceae bacterium]|nr:MFS transporter [Polyangiaceae bacterium]